MTSLWAMWTSANPNWWVVFYIELHRQWHSTLKGILQLTCSSSNQSDVFCNTDLFWCLRVFLDWNFPCEREKLESQSHNSWSGYNEQFIISSTRIPLKTMGRSNKGYIICKNNACKNWIIHRFSSIVLTSHLFCGTSKLDHLF